MFSHDLCSWGPRLRSNGAVNTKSMFVATACPNEADQEPTDIAGGSFCFDCGGSLESQTTSPRNSTTSSSGPFGNWTDGPILGVAFEDTHELYRAVDEYLRDNSSTSNVTMTYGHPIGSWNVSQVTDFGSVFDVARNPMVVAFNEDLSGWDTSAAVSMIMTFAGASLFNGDISMWATGRVTSMVGMFQQASEFQGNLTGWDTSSCRNMSAMFEGAVLFNGDLAFFDTSNVVDMDSMFSDALSFDGSGLWAWDTSSVTSMNALFESTVSFFKAALSSWNVSNVVDMTGIFQYSSFNGDISTWNVANVETFSYAFAGASSFNRDLSLWNVRSATNFVGMVRYGVASNLMALKMSHRSAPLSSSQPQKALIGTYVPGGLNLLYPNEC